MKENTHDDLYSRAEYLAKRSLRPTWRAIFGHLFLLFLTFCTATIAGTLFPFGSMATFPEVDPQSWDEYAAFFSTIHWRYLGLVGDAITNIFTNQETLIYGLSFSLSLLFILICHEMGHYIACRLYRVEATLPYFIPTPPLVGPAGTLGAFIRILTPMPSRRAVFDIGLAGPFAGFIALLPITVIGIATIKHYPPEVVSNSLPIIVFNEPLLFKMIAALMNISLANTEINAFLAAAWVGTLVTALNLIPSGQLDGGHAIFAVFGEKIHRITGVVAFAVMCCVAVLGWIYYNSPSGVLIAVLLGIMMRVKHPVPYDQSAIGTKRKMIAVATLIIFILCFIPFPIELPGGF